MGSRPELGVVRKMGQSTLQLNSLLRPYLVANIPSEFAQMLKFHPFFALVQGRLAQGGRRTPYAFSRLVLDP